MAAFRATLEEITYADVILHLADASSPRLDVEFEATDAILRELGCENAPRLTVWNKIDLLDDPVAINALPLRRAPVSPSRLSRARDSTACSRKPAPPPGRRAYRVRPHSL